jgi:hypothetical protein
MIRHLPCAPAFLLALSAPLFVTHAQAVGSETGSDRGSRSVNGGEKDPLARLTVEFGEEKHSFGNVLQGDLLEHTFVLVSSGENPVEIRQASPTCGCTVTAVRVEGPDGAPAEYVFGDSIAPGQKVFVSGKLDTTHKKNKAIVRINVYTNDPVGLTQLALEADIQPFLRVTPPFVRLGDIKPGETRRRRIDIHTSGAEAIGLELDPSNQFPVPPGMSLDLAPIRPDEDGRSGHWRATVTVGEGATEGAMGYQLRLRSDRSMPGDQVKADQAEPRVYVASSSISGRVLGPVSITPQFVSLGLVRPGQRKPSTLRITSHVPGFDLTGVTVELQGEQGKPMTWAERFRTSVKPVAGLDNAVDVEVLLEGLPEGTSGPLQGVIVIKTGHESRPELQVRLTGVCRSGVKKGTAQAPGGAR